MKENRSGSPGGNPLGTESVGKLLVQFAIPSIISTLVAALYNMVDQIFIGQRIVLLEGSNVIHHLVHVGHSGKHREHVLQRLEPS